MSYKTTVLKTPKCRKKTPAAEKKLGAVEIMRLVFMLRSNSCAVSNSSGSCLRLWSIKMIPAVSVAMVLAPLREIETSAFFRAIAK